MHTNLEKLVSLFTILFALISILSIILTLSLVLVMALWEELPHFFQMILMIHKEKKKHSDDGKYIIG